MHLPPSTSKIAPVIILASSEHRKQAAFPMSCGVENLPIGIVDKNAFFFFSKLKHLLSVLYIEATSLSASNIGHLKSLEMKDFPEPIVPNTPILIIRNQIHLPPSTSKTTPVIIVASSEHRKHAAFPISCGVENRPIGIVDKNDCFF